MEKKRNTKQKQIISEEIEKINTIFSAEELLMKVNKRDSKIGIATIYRFLKNYRGFHSFICDRKKVYGRKNNHCHFTCQKCGGVQHFEIDKLDFIKGKFEGNVCHFQIDVFGLCKKCQ